MHGMAWRGGARQGTLRRDMNVRAIWDWFMQPDAILTILHLQLILFALTWIGFFVVGLRGTAGVNSTQQTVWRMSKTTWKICVTTLAILVIGTAAIAWVTAKEAWDYVAFFFLVVILGLWPTTISEDGKVSLLFSQNKMVKDKDDDRSA